MRSARLSPIAVILGALMFLGAASAARAETRILVYLPFAADGALARGMKVTGSIDGHCWGSSKTNPRPDAWRCTSGPYVYDPCFSPRRATHWVVCPLTYAGRRVLWLNLTRPLPGSSKRPLDPQTSHPAEVTLSGGVRCGWATGAVGRARVRFDYRCSNRAWLLGGPDRSTPLWHILYLRNPKAGRPTSVPILVAQW